MRGFPGRSCRNRTTGRARFGPCVPTLRPGKEVEQPSSMGIWTPQLRLDRLVGGRCSPPTGTEGRRILATTPTRRVRRGLRFHADTLTRRHADTFPEGALVEVAKGLATLPTVGPRRGAPGSSLPESPLTGGADVQSEAEVCHRMGRYASAQGASAVGHPVVSQPGQ